MLVIPRLNPLDLSKLPAEKGPTNEPYLVLH